ncbi:hypothetical protein BASA81_015586 [Batrachochytrium salamandrivorans]|nr:hypothetical protein BASA81_015586 [Batrachochytrium salamandrivorans]
MSTLPPMPSKSVKDIRANFEKHGSERILKTPEQFMLEKKQMAEREYANIALARKKAAAYNMALRQVQITQRKQSLLPPAQEQQTTVRRAARRVSVSLAEAPLAKAEIPLPLAPPLSNTTTTTSSSGRLSLVGGGGSIEQRRGTSLLLATMCEELEVEMKQEELAAIQEEEAARKRLESAVELVAKETAEGELRAAHEEKLRAIEIQELARKQADEARAEQAQLEAESQAAAAAAATTATTASLGNMSLQGTETEKQDRQVLLNFLKENHPDKVGEVDELLGQFKGNLEVLFEELGKTQVFEEKPDNGKSITQEEEGTPKKTTGNGKQFLHSNVDLRVVVMSFYTVYAKSKLPEIDGILAHFANRESDLFRTLEVKYDVTFSPDGTCVPNTSTLADAYSEQQQQRPGSSKFAVDVQTRQLKERLSKQGQSAESVNAVLASGSGMM